MAMLGIMFTVCVSFVRDPNSRLSRLFSWGWPKPLTAGQATFCRAFGILGIVFTLALGVAMTIDAIDRGFFG